MNVRGHDVHVVIKGSGPDVVLVHGASGNTRDMTFSLVDELADRYRIIVFDRPGLGHTPPLARDSVHLRDQADLLAGAALKLGVDRPILVGQSFGGAVVMAWAVHHPENVAAVVSIAGATHPWQGKLDQLYAWLSHRHVGPILAWIISAWVSEKYMRNAVDEVFVPQQAPAGYADAIGTPLILRPKSLVANAQQRHHLRNHLGELAPNYKDVQVPVYAIHGTADSTVSHLIHSEPLVRDVADGNLTLLPGVGHMPHHTNTSDIIQVIDTVAQRVGLR